MSESASMTDTQQSPGQQMYERIREAARSAASWDVVHRPHTASDFRARVRAAQDSLRSLEKDLASFSIADAGIEDIHPIDQDSTLTGLQENFRLLRSAITGVSDRLRVVARLPRILRDSHEDEPRAATAADIYLHAVDGEFSTLTFRTFINELQTCEALAVEELWSFASFLDFALLEWLLVEARTLLKSSTDARQPLISACIKSLRTIDHADWVSIIEPLISFDATLREDPAEAYGNMDFDSREVYRTRVAFISRYSDFSESRVARTALELAQEAVGLPSDDPRTHQRRIHVGYYLIDKGFPQLAARAGFHPPLLERVRMLIRAQANDFYIVNIELITIFMIAAAVSLLLPNYTLKALAFVSALILLPAMQDAVELVNSTVTAIFGPQPLPKLDFSKRIPLEYATMVAVPALLLSEEQVRKLVGDLEVRFLANRDPNLHFALLSDLQDSVAKPHENDSHPLVELAVRLIEELNAKYTSPRCGSFLLLHRSRIFNTRQGVWMGWERKRGKLLDLNEFLGGGNDAFPIKAGDIEAMGRIRYVITLDSDTQLPRDTAAKLIGAIAHPLNQAVIDPKLRIVTAGYGILQPRVGITVQSASRSRLATIYSGQGGFDIYTRAVSDAYQDLFGEGSFTGKGIYEVAIFRSVLDHRFPRNALLSHDLIEGAYARAGLATDIELIDDYPSHYSAHIRRKHRWVRGDWQIAQWMFSRVPEESGRRVRNPISVISRWKIFDNLRRSLVEPCTFILFVAGWLGLPGGVLYWTVFMLLLLAFPALVVLGFGFGGALASGQRGRVSESLAGFGKALLVALLNLIFLPHQTLLSLDAIVRSLVRRFITGKRLLEWETAAQTESPSSTHTPVDRYLVLMPFIAIGLAMLVFFFAQQKNAILFAAPTLLLWSFAYIFTLWLNRPPRGQSQRLGLAEEDFLLAHALRIWRYFSQFGGERNNYLIPDNVEEDGLFEAARVSPTNLGLLLNARQAACELGFLTVPEFVDLTACTLATISKLEKHRGHLYNWYNTESLAPLPPLTVSSVDSGNLVASLYTVRAGTLALGQQPLLTRQLFIGLRTHWQLIRLQKGPRSPLAKLSLPGSAATFDEWLAWLPAADVALTAAAAAPTFDQEDQWWLAATRQRITAILVLLHDYTPWLLPEFRALRELPDLDLIQAEESASIDDADAFCEELDARLERAAVQLANNSTLLLLDELLRASLPEARRNLGALATALGTVVRQAENFAEETEFGFLVDSERRLLSVGYDMATQKLHPACYDMLASEARIATFISVARGDLPQQSWLSLGRSHARAFNRFVLISWTGTMFEYLMPALWMRSYPDTLIAHTLTACVQVQQAFARSQNIPWGISESGYSRKDDAGHYQYQAFGIPQAALKFDAAAGPVVSPYSTFLALGVDSVAALSNLRWMAKAGWVGAYGFYEAADYASSPGSAVIVREWMAHHQGMSLLATLNLLRGNIVQRWFHANPLVRSTELLLNELPASEAVLRAKVKELSPFRTCANKAV
jgi:hypothetical protein